MKKLVLSAVPLAAMTTAAYAEPVQLGAAQMDTVTAAGVNGKKGPAPHRHGLQLDFGHFD